MTNDADCEIDHRKDKEEGSDDEAWDGSGTEIEKSFMYTLYQTYNISILFTTHEWVNDCMHEWMGEDRAILTLAYPLETTNFFKPLNIGTLYFFQEAVLSWAGGKKKKSQNQAGRSFHSENFWERK